MFDNETLVDYNKNMEEELPNLTQNTKGVKNMIKSCLSCEKARIYGGKDIKLLVDCDGVEYAISSTPDEKEMAPFVQAAEECGNYEEAK